MVQASLEVSMATEDDPEHPAPASWVLDGRCTAALMSRSAMDQSQAMYLAHKQSANYMHDGPIQYARPTGKPPVPTILSSCLIPVL